MQLSAWCQGRVLDPISGSTQRQQMWSMLRTPSGLPAVCSAADAKPNISMASSDNCKLPDGSTLFLEPSLRGSLHPSDILALVLECPLASVANTQTGVHTSHALALLKGTLVFRPSGLALHAYSPAWLDILRRAQLPHLALITARHCAASASEKSFVDSSRSNPAAGLSAAMPRIPGVNTNAPCVCSVQAPATSIAPGRPPRSVVLKNLHPDVGDAVAERRACCVLQLLRACGYSRGLLVPYGYTELCISGQSFSATVMAQCCGGTLHDLLYKLMPRVPVRAWPGVSPERIMAIQREAWMDPDFVDRCIPRMPLPLLREVARQLLMGVAALHLHCLAHFDIKLENIGWGIGADGNISVYLLDWTSLRTFDPRLARVSWGLASGSTPHHAVSNGHCARGSASSRVDGYGGAGHGQLQPTAGGVESGQLQGSSITSSCYTVSSSTASSGMCSQLNGVQGRPRSAAVAAAATGVHATAVQAGARGQQHHHHHHHQQSQGARHAQYRSHSPRMEHGSALSHTTHTVYHASSLSTPPTPPARLQGPQQQAASGKGGHMSGKQAGAASANHGHSQSARACNATDMACSIRRATTCSGYTGVCSQPCSVQLPADSGSCCSCCLLGSGVMPRASGLAVRLARELLRDGLPRPAITEAYGPWQAVDAWPCSMQLPEDTPSTAFGPMGLLRHCTPLQRLRRAPGMDDWQASGDLGARAELHAEMDYSSAGEVYDRLCLAQLLATLASGLVPYQYEDLTRPRGWCRQHLRDPWASNALNLCIRRYRKMPRLPPHAEGRSQALESLIDVLRTPHTALSQPAMSLEWLVQYHPFFKQAA